MNHSMMEPLEQRQLLATHLFNLLGYDDRGTSWEYQSSGESSSTLGGDAEISGTTTTRILQKRRTLSGLRSNRVRATSEVLNLTLGWAGNADGTHVTGASAKRFLGIPGLDIDIEMTGTTAAPRDMDVRTTYADDGEFSGTASFVMEGQEVTGTLTGTTHVESRLAGRRDVTVPAGDFRAMKGRVIIELEGTAVLDLGEGIIVNADFNVRQKQVFWSTAATGIVRQNNDFNSRFVIEGAEDEPLVTTVDLVAELIEKTEP